jgi:hypothetical protein
LWSSFDGQLPPVVYSHGVNEQVVEDGAQNIAVAENFKAGNVFPDDGLIPEDSACTSTMRIESTIDRAP